jgi:uncharacterized coiled-coil DUF342 family protein
METNSTQTEKPGFFPLKNLSLDESGSKNLDLDGVGKERMVALRTSISEINEQIKGREKLSRQIFNECEKLKTEINNFLSEHQILNIGAEDNSAIREKTDLRHKKMEISELQLNEKINCWKDISQLKKELREYERELQEKNERSEALARIMEDN